MSSAGDSLARKIHKALADSEAVDQRRAKVAQLRHNGHRKGGSKRAHLKQAEQRKRKSR